MQGTIQSNSVVNSKIEVNNNMNKHLMMMLLATFFTVLMVMGSASAVVTISNGIFNVSVEDEGQNIGTFTVGTGSNHTNPGQSVLYDGSSPHPGAGFLTVRDETEGFMGRIEYTSLQDRTPSTGYTQRNLDDFNPTVTKTNDTQVNTEWRVYHAINGNSTEFTILQSISIIGNDIHDSMVEVSTKITNLDNIMRKFSIRYFWDIQVAGVDSALVRTVNTTGSWLTKETSWISPTFDAWEATDNDNVPTFSFFGSNFLPVLAPPDVLALANYDSSTTAFTYSVDPTKNAGDSVILYYWNGLTIEPRGEETVMAYLLSSRPTWPDFDPDPTPTPDPESSPSNATKVSAGTVPMKATGTPVGLLLVGMVIAVGGAIYSRRNN